MMLAALRESSGTAVAVSEEALMAAASRLMDGEGIDAAPEGGAALAAYESLLEAGELESTQRTVLFNTGAGWLYRQ